VLYAVGEQPWPAIAGRTSYGRGKGRGKRASPAWQQARPTGESRGGAASAPKAAAVLGSPHGRKCVSPAKKWSSSSRLGAAASSGRRGGKETEKAER
jgi:hypothetical protein